MGSDTPTEKHNYKLTDEEFLEALHNNNGMYAQTAKAIEEKYGISYSRQAVRNRAQNFPEELKLIREHIVEICETELLKCVMQNDDKKLKLKAATFILNNIGYNRGYGKGNLDRMAEYDSGRWFS
jgi:hypothetical protein